MEDRTTFQKMADYAANLTRMQSKSPGIKQDEGDPSRPDTPTEADMVITTVLDMFDMNPMKTQLATTRGLNADNVTPYTFYMEPGIAFGLLIEHTDFQYTVNPVNITFDSNGNINYLSTPYTSATVSAPLDPPSSLLGWAIWMRANDMLVGLSSMTLSKGGSTPIWQLGYDLNENSGAAFFWNVDQQNSLVSTPVTTVPAAVLTIVSTISEAAVENFFYFSPGDAGPLEVTGSNAILKMYPIYNQPMIIAGLNAAIMADSLDAFAQAIPDELARKGNCDSLAKKLSNVSPIASKALIRG
jgi:hypothetical protein